MAQKLTKMLQHPIINTPGLGPGNSRPFRQLQKPMRIQEFEQDGYMRQSVLSSPLETMRLGSRTWWVEGNKHVEYEGNYVDKQKCQNS